MPTYNYKCNQCMVEFSVFQSINDKKYANCKYCHKKNVLERLISGGTGMIFILQIILIIEKIRAKN